MAKFITRPVEAVKRVAGKCPERNLRLSDYAYYNSTEIAAETAVAFLKEQGIDL